MKKNKTLLIGVASAVGIALIALAIFIAYTLNPANKYTRTVTSAEKYYQEGDYQNSILAYEDAIAQDPNNVNAYIGLANVYVDQNQTDMAIATLRRYTGPASSRIDLMLANLLASSGSSEGSSEVTVNTTQTIALNTNLLTVVGGYSYADYSSKFGIASRNSNRDGSVTVRVNTIDGDFNYRNTEFQPNAVSATVVEANTIPASLTLDNATSLFGNVQSVSLDTLQTLNLENYSETTDGEHGEVVTFTYDQVRVTVALNNRMITADSWNEIIPLKSLNRIEAANVINVSGKVIDAQTGLGVASVTMNVRENAYQTGEPVLTATSGNYGDYEFDLEPGQYTVELVADGYTTVYKELFVSTYDGAVIKDFTLSGDLTEGTARIVLEWGGSPADLDSYLYGQMDDGSDVFISFYNRSSYSGDTKIAELDLDDTDGYGPETTTIYNLNGTFQFLVADFNRTLSMGNCGATVTVYLPGQAPQSITIGGDIPDDQWSVLEIDHGTLRVVNNGYEFSRGWSHGGKS